jgi:hypothetical protein
VERGSSVCPSPGGWYQLLGELQGPQLVLQQFVSVRTQTFPFPCLSAPEAPADPLPLRPVKAKEKKAGFYIQSRTGLGLWTSLPPSGSTT